MSQTPTHWLYPVSSRSGYILPRPGGRAVSLSPETVWEDVQSEHPHSTSWLLSSGFRLMRAGDLIWIYATDEHQILCALARVVRVFWSDDDDAHRVEMVWDLDSSRALHSDPVSRAQFGGQRVQRVQRANPATAAVLDEWLEHHDSVPRGPDDPAGAGSEAEASAWTLRQVRQRQGQSRFRGQLLKHYSRRCAVTGESCLDVLEAAHITSFAVSENHAASNGLLLRSDLHTLFDLHLVGVDARGALVVSNQITSSTYRALHGTRLAVPRAKAARPDPGPLADHLAALR